MLRIICITYAVLITINVASQTNFKAERISRTTTFVVNGKIQEVFPLFGPMREKEWAEGWNPEVIYPSGAEAEIHMIFRTKASTEEGYYHWTITQYVPSEHFIEYTVSTSNRIWFISVGCMSAGNKTNVTVTYTYTGLNTLGNELNRVALEKMFAENLDDWRQAIDYYLLHGTMLKAN